MAAKNDKMMRQQQAYNIKEEYRKRKCEEKDKQFVRRNGGRSDLEIELMLGSGIRWPGG
jgi:hypothetical protein